MTSPADLQGVLDAIRSLEVSLARIGKRHYGMIGLAGEVLVMMRLHELGVEFIPKGGQSHCDILLKRNQPPRKIEVRTSHRKVWNIRKIGAQIPTYGWVLQRGEKEMASDITICVGLDELTDLDNPVFYAFSKEDIRQAPLMSDSRFKSVSKMLRIACQDEDLQKLLRPELRENFTPWEGQVNSQKEKYKLNRQLRAWGLLPLLHNKE